MKVICQLFPGNILLFFFYACSGGTEGQPAPLKESMIQGDRSESPSRRTSANRPHPWEEEHGPFMVDRFGIAAAMAQRQSEHNFEHSHESMKMESFVHPACTALTSEQKRKCPLTSVHWSRARMIQSGVELEMSRSGAAPDSLRWQVLCHMAYGREQSALESCPLHLSHVRAIILQQGKKVILRIVTDDASQVGVLQWRLKQLVPAQGN